MKNILTIFMLLTILSCKKEQEKTLQDYIGKYSVESTIIKFQYNEVWICGTGLDSVQLHIEDSLAALIPRIEVDTIVETKIISIISSLNSEKEFIVLDLFDQLFGGKDSCVFYNPENTNELYFLHCNDIFINNSDYTNVMELREDEIYFDFKMYQPNTSIDFTYTGLAKRIE